MHRFGKTQLCQCGRAGAPHSELNLEKYSNRSTAHACLWFPSVVRRPMEAGAREIGEGSHRYGFHPDGHAAAGNCTHT